MRNRLIRSVALASCVASGFSAAAAAKPHWHDTQVTIDNFVITLVDLLPDDAISPWIKFDLQEGYTSVLGELHQPGFTSAAKTEAWLYGETSASVASDLIAGTQMRSRAFSKDDPFVEAHAAAFAIAWASTGPERGALEGLLVGPGTKVVISAQATFELVAVRNMGSGYAQLGFVCGDDGVLSGRLECRKVNNPLNRNAVVAWIGYPPGTQIATVESGFANWSKNPVETGFFAETGVQVNSLPEPSTYALLAVGGAMLYGWRRRFSKEQ